MTTMPLPIPMSETDARSLTERIKNTFTSITIEVSKLRDMIETAEASEAWKVLGYSSWTAYVSEEFSGAAANLARATRGPVIEMLSETGMSTRAIAPIVGVSKDTVHRAQVSQRETPGRCEHRGRAFLDDLVPYPEADDQGNQQYRCPWCKAAPYAGSVIKTTGLDGKEYVRHGRVTAAGTKAIAEAVPPVKPRKPTGFFGIPSIGISRLEAAHDRLDQLRRADFDGLSVEELQRVIRLAEQCVPLAHEVTNRATRELGRLLGDRP